MKRIGLTLAVALVLAMSLGTMSGCTGQDDKQVADLAARVTTLEDQLAIQKVVMGEYPHAMDQRRIKDYSQLWAEDGIFVIPSLATLHGPKAIFQLMSNPNAFAEPSKSGDPPRPEPRNYQVPHMIGSLAYEVKGDTATGIAYWTETTLVDGKPAVVGAGHYEDKLRKVNGQWKFAQRTVVRDVPAMTTEQMAHAPDRYAE
jgi:SnoaL-like domain